MENISLWEQFIRQFNLRGPELLGATGVHIKLVLISMLIAIVVGVPAGILVARIKGLRTPIIGVASILQTIPGLALLGFMIPIFGIGTITAVAALFLYSLLPVIRNTFTGIKDVDPAIIEAARGMGLTSRQILFRVQLPLALSVIMAGIRTATVINVGTATLAAFIGAGGLGDFIFLGITRNIDALILLGAIPAAILALVFDYLLGLVERWTTPRGLR
ncbi:ABC transporter permease [Paenibacillus sp. PsM32]|uniref:ABC transporter permease n=1 Tax=Paenibacillus kyungheensis TaxID=1452732 RepID=A0AAX3LVZ8_9BACL|nr:MULTISPECIES: ABC transporter permease [Paenibacillus]MDN4618231.1 ABC transporter permease [Paenibacillus sp. PsM32]MDQ1234254.1 osmoprotectant transport system permease protein [Paenibacillus sp. SORGH_AS_0306]MDR6111300.1 osmoprotectant transport system permease protein [Paenibacillus sp. SORGH_AS_0338]WCT53873.1 ABC transporter permease [Paenibacillus kyungheensis]WDF48761.1 ABC transporter permease [Paenibacillus sp. KACC 21273]